MLVPTGCGVCVTDFKSVQKKPLIFVLLAFVCIKLEFYVAVVPFLGCITNHQSSGAKKQTNKTQRGIQEYNLYRCVVLFL